MKRLFCLLLGHVWVTRPYAQIQEELGHGQQCRPVECRRCGAFEP